ncbi:hypothetical protein [Labrys monachus]|uniref:Uncharacterized protein n=1 Tax=Labrys monachus TaxID=217067 RepID=A0ABU0FAV9_9HYPH|nr:hypothetical protein [Labrys monachus]MDQ0391686.1 hypothetical protein [Labrys monachus]
MDLQLFLALSAASYSAVIIAQMVITQVHRLPGSAKEFAMHAGVIVLAAAGYELFPAIYGYVAALALALTLLPALLIGMANRRLVASRFKDAALYARLAFLLHPTARMRFEARHCAALAQSTPEGRIAALAALQASATPDQASVLQMQILSQRGDWQGLAAFLARHPMRATPELVNHAIRAFGETGQLDAMVRAHASYAGALTGSTASLARLMVLAFCGRVEATRRQLATVAIMPPASGPSGRRPPCRPPDRVRRHAVSSAASTPAASIPGSAT